MPVPNPVVGQFIKVTLVHDSNGQNGEMTFAYEVQAQTGAGISLQQLSDAFATTWNAAFQPLFTAQVGFSGVLAELLNTATGKVLQSVKSPKNTLLGTAAGNLIARQVANVIAKVTGLAGRSNRGRVFWPFLCATDLNVQGEVLPIPEAAKVTLLTAVMLSPTIIVAGSGYTLGSVILHKGAPLTAIAMSNFLGTGKTGTQRRRSDYGAFNPQV
jgi:hypothetical protein